MRRRSALAVAALWLAACRPAGDESGRERAFKDEPSPAPAPAAKPVRVRGDAVMAPMPESPEEKAIKELGLIRDRMCRCKTPACTNEPGEALYAWGKAHPKNGLPPQLEKKRRDIAIDIANCQVAATKNAK